MTNYNDGKWHGWNGGECPVHPETIVQVQLDSETRVEVEKEGRDSYRKASAWIWENISVNKNIIAFRVIKEYKEPREFWVNVYEDTLSCTYDDKESADKGAGPCRIECILVREVV